MGLDEYRKKRDFRKTSEPPGRVKARERKGGAYLIQKHAATRLHYDFRLELDGVLKSWVLPKGPSLDPTDHRLAVHVEDHPLEYGGFEGVIPEEEYGGGTVLIWDRGSWEPDGDARRGYSEGKLKFRLQGEKLAGRWVLVRMGGQAAADDKENWLLIKERDAAARPGHGPEILEAEPESVASGRGMEEVKQARERIWTASAGEITARNGRSGRKRRPAIPDPACLPGARRGSLPNRFRAQLATLIAAAPSGDGWLHEVKFDGYRIGCRIEDGRARLYSRRGNDWTSRFAPIARACAALPARKALLDGEVTVLEPSGLTSFQALQNALKGIRGGSLVYYVFDILHLDGRDLTRVPLEQRKEVLAALLDARRAGGEGCERVRYSDHVIGEGEEVYRQACDLGAEGIVSKRRDAPYRPDRSREWLKVKCFGKQEFIIGGYTDPGGSRRGFGSLLLGVYDDGGRLEYCGRVGTGFTNRMLRDLHGRLRALERKTPAFANAPEVRRSVRGVHWTAPRLVCEVAYTGWTSDGMLRHPSFKGLREDVDARKVRRERAAGGGGAAGRTEAGSRAGGPGAGSGDGKAARRKRSTKSPAPQRPRGSGKAATVEIAGVRLTNPDRVLYPEMGVTKEDLARYYEGVADRIVPLLRDRLLTVVRCPEGHGSECFYQKHVDETYSDEILRVTVPEKEKRATYMAVRSAAGLVYLVQLGTLEFHIWGSRTDRLERPDQMVYDLDPGPGVDWDAVVAGAQRLRRRIEGLGLAAFVKTTGGRGLHVVVPLLRRSDWDQVKEFSKALVEGIVREDPNAFTAKVSKARRRGKIYLDYLRNARGATAVAPYSTRARPGALVATPVSWRELEAGVRPDEFDVGSVPERVRTSKPDPWTALDASRRAITRAMRAEVGLR